MKKFNELGVIYHSDFNLGQFVYFNERGTCTTISLSSGSNAYFYCGFWYYCPLLYASFRQIPTDKIRTIVLSGTIGSFIPAFLFCIAEEHINSSLAGILNALSPLFAILVGVLFYQMKTNKQKVASVLVGFLGLCLLFCFKRRIYIWWRCGLFLIDCVGDSRLWLECQPFSATSAWYAFAQYCGNRFFPLWRFLLFLILLFYRLFSILFYRYNFSESEFLQRRFWVFLGTAAAQIFVLYAFKTYQCFVFHQW